MGREERLITRPNNATTAGVIHFTSRRGNERQSTMEKRKCYTPQLSPELVSRLYHKAKAERVPMTVLTNRLLEEALGNDEHTNAQQMANQHKREPT